MPGWLTAPNRRNSETEPVQKIPKNKEMESLRKCPSVTVSDDVGVSPRLCLCAQKE